MSTEDGLEDAAKKAADEPDFEALMEKADAMRLWSPTSASYYLAKIDVALFVVKHIHVNVRAVAD